jgi:hypothetical protein
MAKKHHLQPDESHWHPSPWLPSQLFLRWTLWKCGNLHRTTHFFLIQRRLPGALLMSPNAITNFSRWWHKWNLGSFVLLPHHQERIFYKACMGIMNSSAILHEFQSSGGGRDHLLQMYAPHSSLLIQVQPSYNFFTPFSIEPCCSRFSQRCLLPPAA